MTGVVLLLVLFFLVALGLGARIGGVRLSLWKVLLLVTASVLVVGVAFTFLSK